MISSCGISFDSSSGLKILDGKDGSTSGSSIGGGDKADDKNDPPIVGGVDFNTFYSIVETRCIQCHNNKLNAPGNFEILSTEEKWKSSPYLQVGSPSNSMVFARIKGSGVSGANSNMPIGSTVSASDLAKIKKYIEGLALQDELSMVVKKNGVSLPDQGNINFITNYQGFLEYKVSLEITNTSKDKNLEATPILNSNSKFQLDFSNFKSPIPPLSTTKFTISLPSNQIGNFNDVLEINVKGVSKKLNLNLIGKIAADSDCQYSGITTDINLIDNNFVYYSLIDLLGVKVSNLNSRLPPMILAGRDGVELSIFRASWFNPYQDLISDIEKVIFEGESISGIEIVNQNFACKNSNDILNCLGIDGKMQIKSAFYGVYTNSDFEKLNSILQEYNSLFSDKKELLRIYLRYLVLNPKFLFQFDSTNTNSLTPELALKRAYYSLYKTVPDLQVINEMDNSSDKTATLKTIVNGMLENSLFFSRGFNIILKGIFRFTFYKSQLTNYGIPEATQAALWESLERTMQDFYKQDTSIKEMLKFQEYFVNNKVLNYSGLSGNAPSDDVWSKESLPAAAGVWNHPTFLSMTARSIASTQEPMAPRRGNYVNQLFVCHEFGASIPDNTHINVDKSKSFRQQFESGTAGGSCASCHLEGNINALGFALSDKDYAGKTRTHDTGGFPIDTAGAIYGHEFKDSLELGEIISNLKNYTSCIGKSYFTGVIASTSKTQNACFIQKLPLKYGAQNNVTIKILLFNMLTSPEALKRNQLAP